MLKSLIYEFVDDTLTKLISLKCIFKHNYLPINYKGEEKEICVNCNRFKDGTEFR